MRQIAVIASKENCLGLGKPASGVTKTADVQIFVFVTPMVRRLLRKGEKNGASVDSSSPNSRGRFFAIFFFMGDYPASCL